VKVRSNVCASVMCHCVVNGFAAHLTSLQSVIGFYYPAVAARAMTDHEQVLLIEQRSNWSSTFTVTSKWLVVIMVSFS